MLSRVQLCDLMDCSPPSSFVHGVFQVRILEWVDISSSRGSSQARNEACISYIGRQILYHYATISLKRIYLKLLFHLHFLSLKVSSYQVPFLADKFVITSINFRY